VINLRDEKLLLTPMRIWWVILLTAFCLPVAAKNKTREVA